MSGSIKRTVLSVLLLTFMLCGCEKIGNEFDTPAEYAVISADTEQETEDTTISEIVYETTEKAVITETETEEKVQSLSYNMPDEFYTKLDEIIKSSPYFEYYDISLAYNDIETGFTLMINPENHYYSASVMKAPYMLYIYSLALDGKADLEQKLVYTEKYKKEGTGVLKNMEFGTEFTVEELIGYALEESDNGAFAMLRDMYPEDGYTEFMKKLGVEHDDDSKAFNGPQICCETALILSRAVYDFIDENNVYSQNLKYHMTNSRNAMITAADGAEIIRKYGWYEGYFHDMAVILGEHNYSLTIMTNLDMLEIQPREYRIFIDLSALIAEFSGQLTETEKNTENMVIINIKKQEVKEMALPKDQYMLLSVINMKLRDCYNSFEKLCFDMEENSERITAALLNIGYVYDEGSNQFIPLPEEEESVTEIFRE